MRLVNTCVEAFLVPVALALVGCGVAARPSDPASAAGVERCGSETRACWQVKTTEDAVEYPPQREAPAAKTLDPRDAVKSASPAR